MAFAHFRLLSFACFGTLIDRDAGLTTALRPLLTRAERRLDRSQLLALFSRHEAAAMADLPREPYSVILAEAHRRLGREWGVPPADEDDRLFARSIDHWPAFADAPGAVQYFKRYGPLALVSNADRASLEVVSRRFELRFDIVLSSQDAQGFKPNSRHFSLLATRATTLGVATRDVLHVCASVPHDLAPAKAAGIAGALIDRHASEARSAASSFGDLAELVRDHQAHLRA